LGAKVNRPSEQNKSASLVTVTLIKCEMLLLRISLVAAVVIANVYSKAVESPLMEGGSEDMEVSDRGRDRGREAMLVQKLSHRINQFIVKKLGGDYKDIEEAKKHESLGNDHVMNMLRVMMYSAKKFLPYDPPKGMGAAGKKSKSKKKTKTVLQVAMTLNKPYKEEYADTNSAEFKALAKELAATMKDTLGKDIDGFEKYVLKSVEAAGGKRRKREAEGGSIKVTGEVIVKGKKKVSAGNLLGALKKNADKLGASGFEAKELKQADAMKGGKCESDHGCKSGTGLKCMEMKCACPESKPVWDAAKGAEKCYTDGGKDKK